MTKRVLILGYHYVDTGMGGVRIRRIARLLPKHGWEPVVVTHPRAENSPPVPEGIRMEAVAAPDLTRLYQRLTGGDKSAPAAAGARAPARPEPAAKKIGFTSTINRWLMVPDKQVVWYRAARRRALELLRQEKFDAIFASLDPRTTILLAASLSRKTGVPAVIEYRDLWVGNPYHHITQATGFHRWLHARLERRVMTGVRRVSAVCEGIAGYLNEAYRGILRQPVALNYNFFDPAEFPARDAEPARPFIISYTGALYGNRTPHTFFEGFRQFLDASRLTPEQCRFCWAGGAAGIDDLAAVLDRTGIRPYLDFMGQIPHREALRLLVRSDAALLIQAPDDTIHIPGKLFEAMGARTPLLALAHPCEVTRIMERCRAGIICPHTAESVASALAEFHRLHRTGTPWSFADQEVAEFSADAAVGRLAALFNEAAA